MHDRARTSRRSFLSGAALGIAGLSGCRSTDDKPGEFAQQLSETPWQTAGPFYPDPLPLDVDNDLIRLGDDLTPAVGEVTHLFGRVLGTDGRPVSNVEVEIWQADATGAYLHPGSDGHAERDVHFQGFGRFLTDSKGRYRFRTIKPAPYPGRTPHIHVAVNHRGKRALTTQLYVNGHPQNAKDDLLLEVEPRLRELLLVDFAPMPSSSAQELWAEADLIVGSGS